MATKFIHGFFPNFKLHKVCASDGMRPVQGYLYFKDGNVYATDSHMAIAAPLSFVSDFTDEEKALLNGKLIHATQFEQLLKMRETYVKETADGAQFECTTRNDKTVIIPIDDEEKVGEFPNVEIVIESARKNVKENKQPISYVGLKPSLLANLVAAMNATIVHFYFSDASHAMVVQDGDIENKIRAILMPCFITDPKF